MSSSNYIQDVSYQSFYNPQLNPLTLWFTAAINGYAERSMPESFRYCDLGCGNGTTLCYLASMYPKAHFVGVDFNATHIAAAKDLANQAGLSNIEFHQLDFASLDNWATEPFDFVVCYGAFSWINVVLQNSILDFVGNRLTKGGLFLVHYAAKPGKVQIDPLWHLMRTVTDSEEGNSIDRVRKGIRIISHLKDRESAFFKQNPIARQRANALAAQDPNYVAHESLTEWQAFFHGEIAQRAREYGLIFAGPAGQSNVPLKFRVPQSFKTLFHDSMDTLVKETLCDYIHNTGMRTDVFAKDVRKMQSNHEAFHETPFGITPLLNETIPPSFDALSGQGISLRDPIPKTILDGLMQKSMTFREILSLPAFSQKNHGEIQDLFVFLASIGAIQPLANHYHPTPRTQQTPWQPSLPLGRLELASDFPLTRSLSLPSAHTGQCASLPPVVALILAAQGSGATQNEVTSIVADKLMLAGKELFPNPPEKQELVKSIRDQLPLLNNKALPRLVAMGVYGAANNGD